MDNAYGLWSLVILNSLIFIIFAFSFAKPQTKTDWRSFGAFSAFLVALFTEMYGFPLTIYLLSGWLAEKYPGVDFLTHENGHLWHTILGFEGDAHFDPMHLLSFVFIGGGFWILSAAWSVLYKAQKEGKLAVTGPYSKVRHPQYIGFILIMFGFLLQWPTLPTLVLFPVLAYMYIRLASKEEADARAAFGTAYDEYAKAVPGFIPRVLSGSGA
ncbi:methyltransferase family protein [Luteithermobacter gelatinilyticus]|uniref:methyltransferase family protein n=1 Tax=Luteithermobacter gelatinilyticus TaxID=2582913 RepID=UPI001105DCB4|nr:isoprenylcysteine carboxylmethyltransferase family protein [Luteithermobacter gelatinilyticus]